MNNQEEINGPQVIEINVFSFVHFPKVAKSLTTSLMLHSSVSSPRCKGQNLGVVITFDIEQ